MKIKIFGPGCVKCEILTKNVKEAVSQLGISSVDIEKVSSIEEMVERGIISVPALMIDGSLKSSGEIPTVDKIKEWLNE